jgi:hypothetical protein
VLAPILATDTSADLRVPVVRLHLAALVRAGRWDEAMPVIEKERAVLDRADLTRLAEVMREAGRAEDAARVEAIGTAPPPLAQFRA